MNKLTKHLTLSAMTIALAGGMGFAQAQSSNGAMGTTDTMGTTGTNTTGTMGTNATGTNPNGMGANPDPNGTLSRSRTDGRTSHGTTTNTPGAFNGEAADTNEPYGRARTQQGSQDTMNQMDTEATRGESARSNNSYGHTRDSVNSDEADRDAGTR